MRTALRLLGAMGLALGLGLAAPVGLPSAPLLGAAPAQASPCSGTGGVTVVVDENNVPGGRGRVSQACVAGSGGTARGLFKAAGVAMQDVNGEQGFVCRVHSKPGPEACDRTPGGGQYWSLWWSSGNGTWTYSQEGVDLLSVPAGGFVAWSWTNQAPTAPAARKPSEAPSDDGNGSADNGLDNSGPGGSGGSGSGSPGDGPSSDGPSASPDGDPSASAGASDDPTAGSGAAKGKGGKQARGGKNGKAGKNGKNAKAKNGKGRNGKGKRGDRAGDGAREGGGESVDSPLTDENGDTEQVSSASDEDPAGLPVWVPVAVLVVLAAGGVGSVVWRRRTNGGA